MSVLSVVVAEGDPLSEGPPPADRAFVDRLAAQLSAEYGADPRAIRAQAADALASLAGARVQAFVPLLVEKRLREAYRRRSGLGSREGFEAGTG